MSHELPHQELPIEVDCASVHADLQNPADDAPILIDCREPDEHTLVHISAASLLPMSQIQERLGELETHRARRIVVHCHHGGRSLRVARWLREQGYPQAQSMAGGIDQWAQEIDPTLARY